jgi:hypothetical protein
MNDKFWGLSLGFGIILLVIAGIARNDYLMAAFASLLFFIIPTANRPSLWWMAGIVTLGSGLSVGLPGDAKLHLVTMLGFVLLILFKVGARNLKFARSSWPRKACISLLVIIILTASFRGWGLKILDSAYWGGMQYVSLMAGLLFFVFSSYVSISQKQLRKMLFWFFVLSLVPAVALVIARFVPHGDLIYHVVEIGTNEAETAVAQWEMPEVTRWAYMQYPAIWMGVLAIILYDRRFSFSPAVILVSLMSFLMMGLSGHRTVVVLLGVTVLVYVIIRRRTVRLPQFLKLMGALSVITVAIYLFADHLPLAFQRAVTWLPGIEVSYAADADALATTKWRIELWRQLIPLVPQHLLVGRGMAFSAQEANAAAALISDRSTQHITFIAVHLYHNGPLWFLIDLGLVGFMSGLVFMIGGIVHYGRQMRRLPEGSLWKTTYIVFYSFFVGYCVFFMAVIGGSTFLIHILIVASVLEVLPRSYEAEGIKPLGGLGE